MEKLIILEHTKKAIYWLEVGSSIHTPLTLNSFCVKNNKVLKVPYKYQDIALLKEKGFELYNLAFKGGVNNSHDKDLYIDDNIAYDVYLATRILETDRRFSDYTDYFYTNHTLDDVNTMIEKMKGISI